MQIESLIVAYNDAVERLRRELDDGITAVSTIETEIDSLHEAILQAQPADLSDLIVKVNYIERLAMQAADGVWPGSAWFDSLRRDLTILSDSCSKQH
jgi:hypothetical protein